jgi:hypothetical protein
MLVNVGRGPYRASREHARDDAIRARGAGGPLSSAILYLAIVAIWAGVLVPRWLRPAQVVARKADARQADTRLADARLADTHMADTRQRAEAAEPGADSDPDTEPIPAVRLEHDHPMRRAGSFRAAQRRMILQARRRMLVMITILTAGAVGLLAVHLAAWWVVLPPGTMLGGFLLMLREAARTDATRSRRLAAAPAVATRPVRQDAAEGVVAAETVTAETVAARADRVLVAEPEPARSAEIIDISARYGDQLYDQYADAAVRAVGD